MEKREILKIKPKELAISGGGIKGIAFLGALSEMDFSDIEKVAGTSIGSLLAVLIALKRDINEIIDIIFEINIMDIGKNKSYVQFPKTYSILDNNNLIIFLELLLKDEKDMTLMEIYNKTNIDLYITTTNVHKEDIVYLNHKTHPDLNIIHAIKMSTAIPFIFPPILYDGHYYSDGGVIDNFPTSILSNDAWGIKADNSVINLDKGDLSLYQYMMKLFYIRYENSKTNTTHIKNIISIKINNNNISSSDFHIDDDEKLKLLHDGKNAVKKCLEKLYLEEVNGTESIKSPIWDEETSDEERFIEEETTDEE